MIESPPKLTPDALLIGLLHEPNSELTRLVNLANQKYEYWTDVKYKKLPEGFTPNDLWACIKFSRSFTQPIQVGNYTFKLCVTDTMHRMCHEFDLNLGGYLGTKSIIPEEDKNRYQVSSSMEEAIASSQMEGAATTRKVAKEMLRKSIPPRTRSEKMIRNNYETIRFILDHRDEPLSREMLLQIHRLMTRDTLEDPKDEGRFRRDDMVVVENGITHETVHTPPLHTEIDELIDWVCDFFNKEDPSDAPFIHPVIKGIIIHFLIGFIHPFADGNGRTARALFYWYMLRKGYWLTEYLTISQIIKKSKRQYEKAYLYTEQDENDLGYFIMYNLCAIDNAYRELKQYIQRKIDEKYQNIDFLKLGNINTRQAQILKWLNDEPHLSFSVKEVQTRMGISYPTAKTDLDALVKRGFLETIPVNKIKHNYVRGKNFDELIRDINS